MRIRLRDPLGVATVALSIAALAVATAYLGLKAGLPSEPAAISADDWLWSADGVVVEPLGEDGPFLAGDVVVAVEGRPLEAWADRFAGLGPAAGVSLPASLRFDVVRDGRPLSLDVRLHRQPVLDHLLRGWALLAFTLVELVVAVLAWLRRPHEGWRRGFVVGSVGNIASAVAWQLGLQPTDLMRSEPTFVLFTVTAPLHLLFWSGIVHLIGSFPPRNGALTGRHGALAVIYGLPQLALPGGVVAARLATSSTLAWIDSWAAILAAIVLVLIGLTTAATWISYSRWSDPSRRRLRPLAIAITAIAVGVLGLTVVPVLVSGSPLWTRSDVALLGLPAIVALVLAVVRDRLFEVAVLDASRRRLVIAREEERRRIRRDLHDGLGPALAAMTLKLDVARDLVRSDPAAAERTIGDLKADTQTAVADIRRLVRDLRPPALDELGLVEAVRHRASELGLPSAHGSRVEVTIDAGRPLPALNAAVEVAAYRIAVEAMTNVVRHARAAHCVVRLTADQRELELEVLDDGVGFDPARPAGVGLSSLRERTVELGGSWSIDRSPAGWTRVAARFPLGA